MPLPAFTDVARRDEFKALDPAKQREITDRYWSDYQAENPDDTDYAAQQRELALGYLDTKARREIASPVEQRLIDSELEDTKFMLALREGQKLGKIDAPTAANAYTQQMTQRKDRLAKLEKTRSLFNPEVQGEMAPAWDALKETAARGGVFGSPRLDARVADILPGGEKDAVSGSKAAYESLRNQMASDFNLDPAEVDDVVKHQLNLQSEPVSRDAFGTPHIKDEIIAAGPEVATEAINNSNLPWPVKQGLVKDLPKKIEAFQAATLKGVREKSPALAAELGITEPGKTPEEEAANFQRVLKELNDSRTEQFGGGFAAAGVGSLELLETASPAPPTDQSGLFGPVTGMTSPEAKVQRQDYITGLRKKIEMVNQLSSQFNQSKTEIFGTDAATYGSGAYSVAEAVGVGMLTAGAGAPFSAARIASMGKTGARLASFANGAIAVSPVAGFAGAKTAASTYEQAIGAGMPEDRAFNLAVRSGLIEAGVTMAFSGFGAGGVEAVAGQLTGTAAREAIRNSSASAWKSFAGSFAKGVTAEQFEEGMIAAFDAVSVQAKIDPTMTVDDFKKQMLDTAKVTLAVSAPTVGLGAAKEIRDIRATLDETPTYEQTTDEIRVRADLALRDAVRREGSLGTPIGERLRRQATQPGAANMPPAGQVAPDTTQDGGAPAPGASAPVAPGGAEPVAPAQGPTGAPAAVPGVQPAGTAGPVLVPTDAGVTPIPTTDEKQIEEASGLPPVEGQPVEPSPASQAEEGAAQRQGEGPQEVAEPVAPPTTTPEPVAEEAPPETFREAEPDWNTVFETLRKREPETRKVDTESPRFKALVTEIKDKRIADKAGQLVQRKADIEGMRAKVEADRKARNDERLKRRREAAKAKPLDPYRKKILELTKDPATGQSVNPDQEVGLRKWLRARGYDASIKKKGFLDGLLGYVVPKEKAKRERLQNLYATLTPEVKEVLEAIYKKPEKGKEEIPVFRKFAETEIGATLLRQPIRSLSSFRDAKEPIPVEYEGLVENRIKGHVQSRIFTRDPNGRTIADVIEDLNVKYAEGGLEGSMIDTQRFSAADIIQAINDLSDNKVKSQEDYDSEMERQQQEAEDAQIAFAEQQLAALQGDVQTVDIAEVRDGDVFTINGVDYRAGRVEQDDRGRTDSFVLFGEGPLNRVKVEEDFFAESVVPTEGSLAGVDPAEIEAFQVAQQDDTFDEPGPVPYSPEALKETFAVTDEQAVAMDALVQAMGLDTSRIRLQRGGVPGDAAMRQEEGVLLSRAKTSNTDTGAYHYGDAGLGKDTKLDRMGGRRTGHFGTGTYFLGAENPLARQGRPLVYLDLEGLKMAKPRSPMRVHEALRDFNNAIMKGEALNFSQPRFTGAKTASALWIELLTPGINEAKIIETMKKVQSMFALDQNDGIRTPSTYLMQELGFDGIDVRGTELDNTDYGSVVFAKPVPKVATSKTLYRGGDLRPGLNYFTPDKAYAERSYGGPISTQEVDDSKVIDLTSEGTSPINSGYFVRLMRDKGIDIKPFFRGDSRGAVWKQIQDLDREGLQKALEAAGLQGLKWVEFGPPQGEFGAPQEAEAYLVAPVTQQGSPESPSILYQGVAKGSFEVVQQTGDILLRGLASPDVSTGVHEIAHAARRMLLNRALPPENRKGITEQDIETVEKWAGAKDGKWSVEAEEKFARGWERYLADGKAPVPALQAIFDKFAKWLGDIYGRIAGSPIDIDVSPEVRVVMDKLVTRAMAQGQTAPAAEPAPAPAPTPAPAPAPAATTTPPPAEPAAPAPAAEIPEDAVGTANVMTDRMRARRGMPPRADVARLGNEQAWDAAMDILDKDGNAGAVLVDTLKKRPRSIDPVETSLFTHELLVRENALDKALDRYNRSPSKANLEAVQTAETAVRDAILTAEQIGTIEGRALQARKILIHQDRSFDRLAAMTVRAQGGKTLSADQTKELIELHNQMEANRQQLELANAKIVELEAQQLTTNIQNEFKKELKDARKRGEKPMSFIERKAEESRKWLAAQRKSGQVNMNFLPLQEVYHLSVIGASYIAKGLNTLPTFTKQLVKDFGRKYLPFAGDIFAKSQELYETAAPSGRVKPKEDILSAIDGDAPLDGKAIYQLVRHYINEDVEGATFDSVMEAVLADLKEFYPDLDRRQLHVAYSNYGKVTQPDPAEDAKKARDYRALARLQSQLEDAQRGLAPLKTGMQRDAAIQEVRDLEKQVRDTMKRLGIQPTNENNQRKNTLDAIKTRLRNEFEDLDKAVKTGVPRPAYQSQVEYDEEAKRLKERRDDRKKDYDAIFKAPGLTQEQQLERAEKLLDRRIAEERKMLAEGLLQRARDIKMGPWTPELRRLKAELDQLKADRRERQRAAKPRKSEDQKKYERDLASLEKRIKEEEDLLAKGLAARQRDYRMGRWTPEMAEMQARLDDLRAQRKELAESLKPEKDEAAIAYEKAVKAIEASIQRYKDIIAGIAKPEAGKKYTPDAEMLALMDQRDALKDAADAVRAVDPARRDKRKQQLLKQLDKSIIEITRKIQTGDLSTKLRTDPFGSDPDVAKLRESQRVLNSVLAEMRRAKMPKRSPEEIRAARDRALLEQAILKLEKKTRTKDYSKRQKLPPPDYTERNALLSRKRQLAAQFNLDLFNAELENRTYLQKKLDFTYEALIGVRRTLMTSIDFGAFFRQAGISNMMRPGMAIRNFPKFVTVREKSADRFESWMESHPDYTRAIVSKLSLTSWRPGAALKDVEEQHQSRFADKVPGILASKRAYVTGLNATRFVHFNILADGLTTLEQTPANLEYLAKAVNIFTGRGDIKGYETAAKFLADLLFSPKYWWSRLQILYGIPYSALDFATGFRVLGKPETRAAQKIVAKEYARMLLNLSAFVGLLALGKELYDPDDEEIEINWDPESSDFGKGRIGNTRFDFMAGLLQNVVFLKRMQSGYKVTGKGERVKINRGDEIIRFGRTKLAPTPSSIMNLAFEEDVVGNVAKPETEFISGYIPLQFSQIYSELRELGMSGGGANSLISMFGIGASTYGEGTEGYNLEQDIFTGEFLVPLGIEPPDFFIDQSRYDKEEKEKEAGYKLPKSKPLPEF